MLPAVGRRRRKQAGDGFKQTAAGHRGRPRAADFTPFQCEIRRYAPVLKVFERSTDTPLPLDFFWNFEVAISFLRCSS